MRNTHDHIDDLIGKYVAGEATPDEVRFIDSWIAESEDNKKYFDQLHTIFSRAALIKAQQQFDSDAAWIKLKSKLVKEHQAPTVQFRPDNTSKLYWRIAASVLIVIAAGVFAYQMLQSVDRGTPLEVVAEKKPAADTLPDGSDVFLNKQTKLSYSFDSKKKTHKVKLQGEAYFNIKHDDNKHFIIDTDGVYIKDIGTSFNVKAYPDSSTIEVVVEEGEVMFYTDTDSGIYLRANGKGVYNKRTRKFDILEPEPNVTAYKTRFFIFSDTDLFTVAQTLNNVYDKKITIGKNLENCRLTVTFQEENVDVIANVIAETLGLTMKDSGHGILLEGAGCIE